MSYFEGIGDEVVVCITLVSVLLLGLLSWALTETATVARPTPPATQAPTQVVLPEPVSDVSNEHEDSCPETHTNHDILEEQNASIVSSTSDTVAVESDSDSEAERSDDLPENSGDPQEESPRQLRQRRLEFFNKTGVEELVSREATKSVSNGVTPVETVTRPTLVQTESEANERLPDLNSINIRLKYLDDTERNVTSRLEERIKDFKRLHFVEEARANRSVRLINNGQVLQDLRTLASYGLTDNTVVHVQVLAQQVADGRSNTGSGSQAESELDLGQFLWPVLGLLLLGVWALHFQYREYFTGASTVALLGLSGLFLTVVWGQYARTAPAAQ